MGHRQRRGAVKSTESEAGPLFVKFLGIIGLWDSFRELMHWMHIAFVTHPGFSVVIVLAVTFMCARVQRHQAIALYVVKVKVVVWRLGGRKCRDRLHKH
jgi:hypothetical protein